MKMKIKVLAVAFMALSSTTMANDNYPNKTIRVIAPFAPGGSVDILARLVSVPLGKELNTPVVVENKPGASGQIGAAYVARTKPDGYTLLANSSIHVITPSLFANSPYDAIEDFIPVSQITNVPLVLLTAPSQGIKTVAQLKEWAEKQKEGLNYASAGQGSTTHIAGEVLGEALGVPVTHIPYKGSGAAMMDVIGGQVPVFFDALTAVSSQIESGALLPIAVAADERAPTLPHVPTFKELGYEDLSLSTWHGVWAPKGTPKEIVIKLSTELQKVAKQPDVAEKIAGLGGTVVANTSEQFDAFARSEQQKWDGLIKKFNIRLE